MRSTPTLDRDVAGGLAKEIFGIRPRIDLHRLHRLVDELDAEEARRKLGQ